ncbi:hypothetical protein L0657_20340 [Dyadobacter sp. CY345]|uniref:reprolysin-like metallopeptidase n=1 Tax=Dyadobacter sp. CY345 TaxID=2909335 RepID=UPI001F36597D|nr:hypothetical protein [Dyadobacter sp. CY345]MCF2446319.1 hypothetical protein [Dyadobacter sp. CY345]
MIKDKIYLIVLFSIALKLISCNNQSTKQSETSQSQENVTIKIPKKLVSGTITGTFEGCGYNYKPNQKVLTLYLPREREINQINSILKYSGLTSNFTIYSAPIENAVATIIDNKRFILYDPKLLSYSDHKSGSYWSSMSILAHEIGHHLSGHTISNNSSGFNEELEADKFSGFILYKLGASLFQATAAIKTLGSETASNTHPAKYQRIDAITIGWNEANQQRYNSAIPPPPQNNNSNFYTYTYKMLFEKENIAGSIISEEDIADYDFFYGIITDVELDNEQVKNIRVFVHQTGSEWHKSVGSMDNEIIKISLDDYWKAPEICMACGRDLPFLLVPGRRIKFAFTEGLHGGSGEAGWFRLSYAEGLNGKSF